MNCELSKMCGKILRIVNLTKKSLRIVNWGLKMLWIVNSDPPPFPPQLTFVAEWCRKWRLAANTDKTKVVHFRKKSIAQTTYNFYLGSTSIEKVSTYKYLGVLFDEFLDFEENARLLADSAGRALGAIRTKLKYLKECGFNSFNTLFKCGVLSICD